jgi:hypothetical protein
MTDATSPTVGMRLKSQVCDTEVMVVRVAGEIAWPSCGGHPMVKPQGERDESLGLDPEWADGSLLGKRYVAEGIDVELLVVKPGAGSLAVDGVRMTVKAAKQLPSSD